MKFFLILLITVFSTLSFGYEVHCMAMFRGTTNEKPYEEIEKKLILQFENQDYIILESLLFERYFAATFDKMNETILLQIVNSADSAVGQTSKATLAPNNLTSIFEIKGGQVYSLSCFRK